MRLAVSLVVPLAVFAAVTALAALAGVGELGRAATAGQLGFALALVVVLLRDRRPEKSSG